LVETVTQLRKLSDDELVGLHDNMADHTTVGTKHYLDELARREAARQTESIVGLTQTMARLTWLIAGLTLVNLVAAFVAIMTS
jgi:hypothetical protein